MSRQELTEYMKELGWPAFRASQLYGWMHRNRVQDVDQMKKTLLEILGK